MLDGGLLTPESFQKPTESDLLTSGSAAITVRTLAPKLGSDANFKRPNT